MQRVTLFSGKKKRKHDGSPIEEKKLELNSAESEQVESFYGKDGTDIASIKDFEGCDTLVKLRMLQGALDIKSRDEFKSFISECKVTFATLPKENNLSEEEFALRKKAISDEISDMIQALTRIHDFCFNHIQNFSYSETSGSQEKNIFDHYFGFGSSVPEAKFPLFQEKIRSLVQADIEKMREEHNQQYPSRLIKKEDYTNVGSEPIQESVWRMTCY